MTFGTLKNVIKVAAVLASSAIIFGCTRPSTVNFINMGSAGQIGFNPKGIQFGLGISLNGRAIELGGTFLIRIDSLEVFRVKPNTNELLWKINSNGSLSPGLIVYGKPPDRFKQSVPETGEPPTINNNDIIKAVFSYKSVRDTITALYANDATSIILKTKIKR